MTTGARAFAAWRRSPGLRHPKSAARHDRPAAGYGAGGGTRPAGAVTSGAPLTRNGSLVALSITAA